MKAAMVRRNVLTVVGAAAMGLAMVMPAFAATDTTDAEVIAGTLSISAIDAEAFEDRSITGVAQTTTADLAAFSVSDFTGTGAGWHVTAQASQFTTGGAGAKLLDPSSLTMTDPTVDSPATESPDPDVTVGPYTLDAGSAVKIASAALNEGMGKYDFSATTLTLSLPADVYAGTYTSTLTFTAITAP